MFRRQTSGVPLSATGLVVCTTKPDKYDRYLADVFLTRESGDDVFLNNTLLENGHALPKDAWEFGDWDKVQAG